MTPPATWPRATRRSSASTPTNRFCRWPPDTRSSGRTASPRRFSAATRSSWRREGQPPAALAIEYAIWWDWDIGHLYELEHAWVYVDAAGRVVRAEASWHGGQHDMRLDGRLALDGDHVVLFSEPGKHAFAPTPAWFRERRRRVQAFRDEHAGRRRRGADRAVHRRPSPRDAAGASAGAHLSGRPRLRAVLGLLAALPHRAGDARPLARAVRVDARPGERDPRPAGRRDPAVRLPFPARRPSRRGRACARQHAAGHPPGRGARRGHGRD